MRVRRRRWWAVPLLFGMMPGALAFQPNPSRDDRDRPWIGRGVRVALVAPVGPELVLSGGVRAETRTIVIPELEPLADSPRVFGILGLILPTRIIELLPEGSVDRLVVLDGLQPGELVLLEPRPRDAAQ